MGRKMILPELLLTFAIANVASSTLFSHPEMCGVYQQRPFYLDRGMYLVPVVLQLPDNCHRSECRRVENGTFHWGTQHQTRTGQICQEWAWQKLNKHTTTKEQITKFGLEKNYCRNPSMNKGGPWCYTTDGKELHGPKKLIWKFLRQTLTSLQYFFWTTKCSPINRLSWFMEMETRTLTWQS